MALSNPLHQRLLPDTPQNKIYQCPNHISPAYHLLGFVERLEMRVRHLGPPQSHCFGDQRQLKRFQAEKI